jgi:magnesium-transporting ATPase (P-type)
LERGKGCKALPIVTDYTLADEKDMVFMGYLTFHDPPLEDAHEVMHMLLPK